MTEIGKIELTRVNNASHFLFIQAVLEDAEADTAVKNKCAAQVAALRAAFEEEDAALKISSKNLITDEIVKTDGERDKIFSGLRKMVDALRGMPMEDTAKPAGVLWQSLKDYGIDVRMQLEKETGLIVNLVGDMEKKFAGEVEALALGKYVQALKESNQKVRDLIRQRSKENFANIVGRLRMAREASDVAYQALVKMVNAQALVTGSSEFDGFINGVNAEIQRYRREVLGQKPTAVTPAPGGDDTGSGEPGTETPGGGTGETPGGGDQGGDGGDGGSDFS